MTDDDLIAALAELGMHDVSQRRSRRLRRRCHGMLQAAPPPRRSIDGAWLRRILVPALGGAWCLAYLVEIIRRTAAIYFGAV